MDSAPVKNRLNMSQFVGPNGENDVMIEGSCGGPYMVEKIVGIYMGKDKKKYYRVKWIDSWEPEENLSEACQGLINEFWTGTTLDPSGKIVKKDELKQGLKVIKKEVAQPPSTETKVFPQANSCTPFNKKPDEGAIATPVASHALLKSEALTPSVDQPTGEMIDNGISKFSEKLLPTDPPRLTRMYGHVELSKAISPTSPARIVSEISNESTSIPSMTSNNSVKRSESDVSCKPLTEIKKPNQKPTTSNHLNSPSTSACPEVSTRSNFFHKTSIGESDDEAGSDCVESPVRSIGLQCQVSLDEAQETNNNVELRTETADAIDVHSDDDVEITVSIQSPLKRKRGRGRPPSSSSVQTTPPSKRRRDLMSMSAPNHLRSPNQHRNSSISVDKAVKSTRPIHPRRLLHQSSLSDGEQSAIHSNPVCHSTAYAPNRRHSETVTSSQNIQQDFFQSQNHPQRQRQHEQNHVSTGSTNAEPSRHLPTFVSASTESSTTTFILKERTCTICKYTFANITLARQHVKKIHSSPSDTSLLTCDVCSAMFKTNRDLKSHMLLHGDHTSYQCEVCLRAFKKRVLLNQHMLIHSQDLPFCCEICNKKFRQQSHLILHMGRHGRNNEAVYTCPHCLQDFTEESLFTNHMRQHDAELPFCCNSCQERFKQKSDLLLHLDGHNEGRPFTCHICKKSFKMKTYLYGHMQMHKVQKTKQTAADSTTTVEHEEPKEVKIKKQSTN